MSARGTGAGFLGIALAALLASPSATAAPGPRSALEQALMAISAAERSRDPAAALAATAAARQARNHLQNNALAAPLSEATRSWPAAGRVIAAAGRTGLDIRTAPEALVLAPAFGRVSFAGAVDGHNQVLILDQGNGYASVLTGLGEVYVGQGDRMLRGEPLGRMPKAARKGGLGRSLYFEVRAHGAPIDPRRWLSGEKLPPAVAAAAGEVTGTPQRRLKVASQAVTAASPPAGRDGGSKSARPRVGDARET